MENTGAMIFITDGTAKEEEIIRVDLLTDNLTRINIRLELAICLYCPRMT